MINLTDALLQSYIDDELDAPTRLAVEEALEEAPGARLRIERIRSNDACLRRAYPLQPATADDPLAARILADDHDLFKARSVLNLRRGWANVAAFALAAGVCGFAVGRIANWDAASPLASDSATAMLSEATTRSLNDNASGFKDAKSGLSIAFSFQSKDGDFCRQFEAAEGEGIACHQNGGWRLRAWDASSGHASAGYATAGASEAIDAVAEKLGAAEPLPADQERALIQKSWR